MVGGRAQWGKMEKNNLKSYIFFAKDSDLIFSQLFILKQFIKKKFNGVMVTSRGVLKI